ncbi:hypothetical protein QCA50_007121 [Cerrena zonata]|uniref:Uncharacterized protein n=1 Tax=Cerrena zonata TaxID=2478898 RepID=A0AAW0GDX0_9APHY
MMVRHTRASAKASGARVDDPRCPGAVIAPEVGLAPPEGPNAQSFSTSTQDSTTTTVAALPGKPPKRKRGRPRKSESGSLTATGSLPSPPSSGTPTSRKKPVHAARANLSKEKQKESSFESGLSSISINTIDSVHPTSHLQLTINSTIILNPNKGHRSSDTPISEDEGHHTLDTLILEDETHHSYDTRPGNDRHPGITAGLAPRSMAEISLKATKKRDKVDAK